MSFSPHKPPKKDSFPIEDRTQPINKLPNLITHADWGSTPNRRVLAKAWLQDDGSYLAEEPLIVVDNPGELLQVLRSEAGSEGKILAGFDFPIGLPASYAENVGISDYLKVLPEFGFGRWQEFYNLAEVPDQVNPYRPFYPHAPGGAAHAHLVNGLGVNDFNDLRRRCEQGGNGMHPATPLFWTLGPGQVGAGAIIGWRDMLAPALRSGEVDLKIWPFQGKLAKLIASGRIVVTETYPSEFRHHLGINNGNNQENRIAASNSILGLASSLELMVPGGLQNHIQNGFGNGQNARDQYDAFVGLIGMLNVLRGNRPEGVPTDDTVFKIEGWILGKLEG